MKQANHQYGHGLPGHLCRAFCAALVLAAGVAAAQECNWEIEPNDMPHQATLMGPMRGDAWTSDNRGLVETICMAGEFDGSDQDMFVLEVDEQLSNQLWTIDVEGFSEGLTRLDLVQLDFLDNQMDVTARYDLLTVESLYGNMISSPPFLLAPGRYYFGLSKAGGEGEYVALMRPIEDITRGSTGRPGAHTPRIGEFRTHGALAEGLELPWQITEDDADALWRLELRVPLTESASLSVVGPSGSIATADTNAAGQLMLDGLGLGAGDFTVVLDGEVSNHQLVVSRRGRQVDGFEVEPNNTPHTANLFPPGTQMQGTATDQDWFLIGIDAAAAGSAWKLLNRNGAVLDLLLRDSDDTMLLERRGVSGDLDPLMLPEGDYYLRVMSPDQVEYSLELQAAGTPQAGWEVEPNDSVASATPIGDGGQLRGELSTAGNDTDVLAYEVTGEPQMYRVQVVGSGNLQVSLLNASGGALTSADGSQRLRIDNLQLLAGVHYFRVRGDPGEYAFRVLPLGPVPETDLRDLPDPAEPLQSTAPSPAGQTAEQAAAALESAVLEPPPPAPAGTMEMEPNDDTTRAQLLVPGVPRVGSLHGPSDRDFYRFFLADDQPVRLELVGPEDVEPLSIHLRGHGTIAAPRGAEPGTVVSEDVWLLAGDHYVELGRGDTAGGWYQLRLTQLNAAMPREAATDLPVDISLVSNVDEVAAYWHQGQQVDMTAELRNTGSTPLTLQLNAATSDARASAEVQPSLTLAAGASAQVPLTLDLPADLRSDIPLNVSLAASSADASSGGQLALSASCEAQPVNPSDWWSVPDSMLGRLNVLWRSFGADLHGAHNNETRSLRLFDGMVTPATGGWLGNASVGDMTTVVLAGDSPVEVVGMVLHPLNDSSVENQLRSFRVETSIDGSNFTTVFEGELKSARIDQAFLFDQPVRARYVRLAGLDSHRDRQDGGYLGEVRLLARDVAPLGSHDLADPRLGGHVVWSEPHFLHNTFLDSQTRVQHVDLRATGAFTFVHGFHNTRAAQITRLEWQDFPEAVAAGETFASVRVEVSLTGAAGPWTELADWNLERSADGTAVLDLDEPTWVRYLRFTATHPGSNQQRVATPHRLSAIERQADGTYLSILGEWGTASPRAIYEHLNQPPGRTITEAPSDNESMQTATPLASGSVAEGTVLVGEDIDWYRLSIEPGENQLVVRLSGEPVIAYEYELVDAAGQPVAAAVNRTGAGVTLTMHGDPGDYYLRIEEPRRSVVFSWDTSGSMGPYLDITYNALTSFATDVSADRERVQLLAFNVPTPTWLLPIWTGDSSRLQQTIVNYSRKDNSSNSEVALIPATIALGQREGTRAILLITDAETGSYGLTTEVWRAIEDVMPRIFTFEVSSGGGLRAQQMMQGWAAANHGHYTLAAAIGDLDNGFNRANCILRRPKHYRLEVESAAVAPPGPGRLSVTRPEGTAEPAVQIIFDASGSMGATLPSGEQRITAAKRVLEDLILEGLAPGSPFALRAFGQVEPTTCNMRLEVPFGPLDPQSALQAVRGIEMKLLSQTPLAEAILATGDDLAQAGRSRTIILITDGVESCGGDPAAAVRELRSSNPVAMAIVSLGIPDEQIASFNELAEAINASYVDVGSFEQLRDSIAEALNPSFEVFDADGQLVATGTVDGQPVELEMGVYTVRVTGAGVREYPGVQVPGESTVELTHAGQ